MNFRESQLNSVVNDASHDSLWAGIGCGILLLIFSLGIGIPLFIFGILARIVSWGWRFAGG